MEGVHSAVLWILKRSEHPSAVSLCGSRLTGRTVTCSFRQVAETLIVDVQRQTYMVLMSIVVSCLSEASDSCPGCFLWPRHVPSCCSLLDPDSCSNLQLCRNKSFFLIKRHLYHCASRRKLPQTLVCCIIQRRGSVSDWLNPHCEDQFVNTFILCKVTVSSESISRIHWNLIWPQNVIRLWTWQECCCWTSCFGLAFYSLVQRK